MNLGNSLFQARKKRTFTGRCGGKIRCKQTDRFKMGNRRNCSRYSAIKKMAVLYNVSLDELIDFDIDIKEIQETIDKTSEEVEEKIDWTNAWGKKYPILLKYQAEVNIPNYANKINIMLDELKQEYHFNEQDAMLVLKDILYNVWKNRKNKSK